MNEPMLNQVIDKLAEKFGVAVDKVQPMAEEVLRQYVMRASVEAVMCFVFVASLIVYGSWAAKKARSLPYVDVGKSHPEVCGTAICLGISVVISFVLIFILAGVGTQAIMRAVAPLPSILGL